ncbi:MAG: cyclodeaminase/cyclohydrolase family protein [Phycisphaerales bacterium]|nr:cyclodeaminase/cyclohydrolase family protein [Phycisphaerales bacterium]MCI0629751.1 cyclodeaminase/cyclohydrolase family protein [Phycisphaerales bacterium]MCI0674401.1 cyclodeaminase/cyclohydrolase family protein [Phycisphaerales bacterium]
MHFDNLTIRDLLDAIAAKSPTPGGGAVASFTAALAAALAQMVINYSVGKRSLAEHDALHLEALHTLGDLSNRAIELAEQDARAYAHLNEIAKLDKKDDRRRRDYPAAVAAAIDAPKSVVDLSLQMLELMKSLLGTTNPHLKSDLAIAAVLANAAARAAAWNVRINAPLLENQSERDSLSAMLDRSLSRAASTAAAIEKACA